MFPLPPLVMSGPSGVGKSTLIQRLFKEFPDKFGFSVSHTTRPARSGEVDGQHYHFVSKDKFQQLLQEKAFIEHAEFSGNFYGTSFETVRKVTDGGRRCLLDIESQVCTTDPPSACDTTRMYVCRVSAKSNKPTSTLFISSSPHLPKKLFALASKVVEQRPKRQLLSASLLPSKKSSLQKRRAHMILSSSMMISIGRTSCLKRWPWGTRSSATSYHH